MVQAPQNLDLKQMRSWHVVLDAQSGIATAGMQTTAAPDGSELASRDSATSNDTHDLNTGHMTWSVSNFLRQEELATTQDECQSVYAHSPFIPHDCGCVQ